MRRVQFLFPLLGLVVFLVAGCAGSQEVMGPPAVGEWNYSLSTPEGTYTGILTVAGTAEELTGTIVSDQEGGEPAPLQELTFEDPNLSFVIQHPEHGRLAANTTVEGDSLSGTLSVPGAGDLPLTGSRIVE